MKFYVVTKGDYSNYHIVAITTDKKKAERLKELHKSKYLPTRIEVFEENTTKDFPVFEVFANENGEILEINLQDIPYFAIKDIGKLKEHPSGYILDIQTETEEKAKKIFYDILSEHKAVKEGIV